MSENAKAVPSCYGRVISENGILESVEIGDEVTEQHVVVLQVENYAATTTGTVKVDVVKLSVEDKVYESNGNSCVDYP